MRATPVRIVLAIFPSDVEQAKRARRALADVHRLCLIESADDKPAEFCRRFAALRLEGESMLAVEAEGSRVESVVKIMRLAGTPAIFVVRPDLHAGKRWTLRIAHKPIAPSNGTRNAILARLEDNQRELNEACGDLLEAARLDHALTPAAEWILDNSYLIHTQITEVNLHLPRDYAGWSSSGKARTGKRSESGINGLAHRLMASTDYAVTENNIREALVQAQAHQPLSIAELWSFPLFLRIALIEALAHLAMQVSEAQQLRELAYLWANRLAAAGRIGGESFDRILRLLESEPVANQPYFITALAEQLQDEEIALAPVQRWIEGRFHQPLFELVREQHTREAGEVVSTANAFGSLRMLAHLEFPEIFEQVSLVEAELRRDPSGVYGRSDFHTRDLCRRAVERIARDSRLAETEVARRAVELARQEGQRDGESPHAHVPWFLLAEGLPVLEKETGVRLSVSEATLRAAKRHATAFYLTSITVLAAAFTVLAGVLAWEGGVHKIPILAALIGLALFPLSELSLQIVNALVISLLPPKPLPKMEFQQSGIPQEHATLVVVPMMLSNLEVVRAELEKLEVRYLGNRDPNLFFSLYSDFMDAPEPTVVSDDALYGAIGAGIEALNVRYPAGHFLLFHRPRVWSESEQRWIGRERKRGKLEELNAFLCGEGDGAILRAGRLPVPVSYVITLDADTQLPLEVGRRLVETIAHPLNRVEIDPVTRVRRRGYTIIQPRVSITLPSATATRFTRIFADATGTDPYSQTVSDAQQDLFLEAIFHGKAIYDVRAFHRILGNRFPLERLLSHDLIEGAHGGVGLATDIELFEHLPVDYASYARRQHRWTRGDWQIAQWGFWRVPGRHGNVEQNPLSLINRWRILDNLRRSLVPVAALLLLLMGWLISPAPGVWSLVVALAIAIPAVTPLLDRLVRRVGGSVHRWQGAADEIARAVVMLSFLPHQAWITADAIVRVFYRRFASRRNLLEWQTAEGAKKEAHRHMDATFRELLTISALSAPLAVILLVERNFAPTSAFVVLWAISPLLMRWLAESGSTVRRTLGLAETHMLRDTARHTWRYFDDLVNDSTNWLPPDNTQLSLRIEVAARTSPTNIGMWFTSALCARDFGYLTADEFCRRVSRTMDTLKRLERYEGHLLNWYNTSTLEPLNPRYVSTVDSGNLIATLWVLEQGCKDILRAPAIGHASMRGLSDTLSTLAERSGDDPSAASSLDALRRLLRGAKDGHNLIARLRMAQNPMERLIEAQKWSATSGDEPAYWAEKLAAELAAWNQSADRYLRWMDTLASPPDATLRAIGPDAVTLRRRALHHIPSLSALAEGNQTAVDVVLAWRGVRDLQPAVLEWLVRLEEEYSVCRANARATVQQIEAIMARSSELSDGINMGFLYDSQRKLFGVGYAVGGPREFTSHYDLLASECRLASLVSIAKGDVPAEHWQALYRPYAYVGGGEALLSWSGTMFEYLMPVIFTRIYTNSLLDRACRNAVERQIEHGEENDVPWGISESAYSAIDAHRIYQYRAFGVPSLALNPAVENELVVAPYATLLALQVDAAAGAENLQRLRRTGLAGPMGLYESIDFTRESTPEGERGVIVYTYMAHHQGMSLAALNNVLHRDVLQRRFHGDLRIRAVESLLFERIPLARMPKQELQPRMAPLRLIAGEDSTDRVWAEETTVPRVNLHGNGRYALMISNSGGGYSRWNDFDLTRWRSDPALDPWGSFIYLRDTRSDEVWSASNKPFISREGETDVRFSADRTELRRRIFGIETILEVTVASEDDAELRRIKVINRSLRARQIEFTSYMELSMTSHGADKAHPAFAKMFIETESPEPGILIAHRRPRSHEDPPIWMGHALVGSEGAIELETDRAKFLGRGNTAATATALRTKLSGSVGTVIDPVFSLRARLDLDIRDRTEITFVTVAAATREAVIDLLHKYLRPEAAGRAFEMAWTRAQLEFRFLGIGPGAAHRFQKLASQLLYPNPRLRPSGDRLARNRLGQQGLWAMGISGDLPIVAVTIAEARNLSMVREVLLAHAFWRLRGFRADLVILNQESPGYDQPLRQQLLRHIEAHSSEAGMDRPGGIFVRDWFTLSADSRDLLLAAASITLSAGRGPLQQQLAAAAESLPQPAFIPTRTAHEEPSAPLPFLELPYFNGLGGFTPDGREYAIYLKPGSTTPAPWVNVMANANFGTMVSESGLGFTWFGNSQANRLTPWQNDPVSDVQSEIVYLRDDDSGAVWTPTALPAREKDAYRARHAAGYTIFEHNSHAIAQELAVYVPIQGEGTGDPVKICRLSLRNESSHTRRLTVTWFAEWVLGSNREDQQLHMQSSRDEASGALLARQYWNASYPGQYAFAASSPRATSWSSDRTQFLGRNMSRTLPAALEKTRLDNRSATGSDPGAALQVGVTLEPGEATEVTFLLGQGESMEHVREIVGRYADPGQVDAAFHSTAGWWNERLGALQVKTPVLSVDILLNRWLLYQALSCRFWGRSALYQSGGAFGFRDQLQDCLAFVYSAPQITRRHILLSASRQFAEGDVQHWWHPETGSGVRTRCSDDLVWLPFAVAHYVRITGDTEILNEEAYFLDAPVLNEGELERMSVPAVSTYSAPLWEHCRRALDHAWKLGPHQLPLMGNGDWNDGMNLVGAKGKGESVWLGWFLYTAAQAFSAVMEDRDAAGVVAAGLVGEWRRKAAELMRRMEEAAWDGEWYLRAFFDDGTPLGSHANAEAKIDSLPQSWAVISAAADARRARQAMESAERYLAREKDHLVLLFTPPFDHSEPNPGYIMGYPPGLRENGGQYTHGALWMAMAWARLNEGKNAVRLLQMMNPVELTRTPEETARYRGEPYVVAADVSSAPGRVGQSGWTWYTGSAGWMYRVWVEEVLGLKVRGEGFTVEPAIPDEWPGFEMTWRHRSATYEIKVGRRGSGAKAVTEMDGERLDAGIVPLRDDGAVHRVTVWLPGLAELKGHEVQRNLVTAGLAGLTDVGENGGGRAEPAPALTPAALSDRR